VGLLERTTDPSREQIKEALSGNLCRCTGYTKILDAVEAAAKRLRGVNANGSAPASAAAVANGALAADAES